MNIKNNIRELVGNTPMVYLENFSRELNLKSKIIGKIESFNPTGSVKDRAALKMIQDALDGGVIDKNSTIIEPTSGNTGIGLAAICASLSLKIVIVLPDSFSIERRKLLKALGAELVLTKGSDGMAGAIRRAQELNSEIDNSYIPQQFNNKSNALAHIETTADEIWRDTEGEVDAVICGVGTGGTITGVGMELKKRNPNIKVIAIEPYESSVLSGNPPGSHSIQGIGAGFVPEILDLTLIDKVLRIKGSDAADKARQLAKSEGLLVGISSGAILHGASIIANKEDYKNIVVILPDTGERYLSTSLYG